MRICIEALCLRFVLKNQMIKLVLLEENKCEGGWLRKYSHQSTSLNSVMKFSIYLPCSSKTEAHYPSIYCLAGLSTGYERFPTQSGFARHAQQYQYAVVFPDNYPHGCPIPHDTEKQYSPGFYLNTTSEKYAPYLQMFTYITQELPSLIEENFPVRKDKRSLIGWSMGGMGALLCAFKTDKFCSISAFAPLCNPIAVEMSAEYCRDFFHDWKQEGKQWDPYQLVKAKKFRQVPLWIEVGTRDDYKQTLRVHEFIEEMQKANYQFVFKQREDYDHTYYYLATFIGEHFQFHSKYLSS